MWGTCGIHTYTHLKHTGDDRLLSISEYGSCSKWEGAKNKLHRLHAFNEFIESDE